jgi:hypothetical protein
MQEDFDYYQEEDNFVRNNFDLEDILSFQKENDIQIIRGEDYQYQCYINKECYYISLTPLYTLLLGIKHYRKYNESR